MMLWSAHRNSCFFIVLCILALAHSGCRRYENGTEFSLRSKEKQMHGKWIMKNTTDFYYGKHFWIFDKHGKFGWESDDFRRPGTWQFSDKKESAVQVNISGELASYKILRLGKRDLWLESEDGERWMFARELFHKK